MCWLADGVGKKKIRAIRVLKIIFRHGFHGFHGLHVNSLSPATDGTGAGCSHAGGAAYACATRTTAVMTTFSYYGSSINNNIRCDMPGIPFIQACSLPEANTG